MREAEEANPRVLRELSSEVLARLVSLYHSGYRHRFGPAPDGGRRCTLIFGGRGAAVTADGDTDDAAARDAIDMVLRAERARADSRDETRRG